MGGLAEILPRKLKDNPGHEQVMATSSSAMTQGELEDQQGREPWFLRSTAPVFLPADHALTLPESEFEEYLRQHVRPVAATEPELEHEHEAFAGSDTNTNTDIDTVLVSEVASPSEQVSPTARDDTTVDVDVDDANDHPFLRALLSHQPNNNNNNNNSLGQGGPAAGAENRMWTDNGDVAYRSTAEPLVDLFSELEDVVSGPRLRALLDGAWAADPTATLKIIFNARSIHLGKASRPTFYRCAGWLAENHPRTLLANLAWLSRPVIPKKADGHDGDGHDGDGHDGDGHDGDGHDGDEEEEEDVVMVDGEADESSDHAAPRLDVKNGVAHGCWKDLLNLLALAANGQLDVLADPRAVLNVEPEAKRFRWPRTRDEARRRRRATRDARHEAAVRRLGGGEDGDGDGDGDGDPVYRGLHLCVARLFAAQLRADAALLRAGDPAARRAVSLCAKWAPSAGRFHDRHTFVVSSIAEILHPRGSLEDDDDADADDADDADDDDDDDGIARRTRYLRRARDAYRRDVAALRRHLEVVERDVTAGAYARIRYDRVPSAAMHNYAPLFAARDPDRFGAYIDRVAGGRARISGATLLPSTLVRAVREAAWPALAAAEAAGPSPAALPAGGRRRRGGTGALVRARVAELTARAVDLQWDALVRRVRDAGALENCIAVADVSGSMLSPVFPDGTCPMDSSIGLALLIAEVARPPFAGAFVTFSTHPAVQRVDPARPLRDKYHRLSRAGWEMRTDLVAVFERLLLPLAVEHRLRPEDMVRRVFVLSDMQFDAARPRGDGRGDWATSRDRIERRFREAGYEMPELVFWNLAGGRGGGGAVAPKPVVAGEDGVALVSGYSQGLLKVFLDGGSFEDGGDEGDEVVESIGEGGDVVVVEKVRKRQKLDPMGIVRKAIGHKAYDMLRVVD